MSSECRNLKFESYNIAEVAVAKSVLQNSPSFKILIRGSWRFHCLTALFWKFILLAISLYRAAFQ